MGTQALGAGIEWRRSAIDALTYHATHPLHPAHALCRIAFAWGSEPEKILVPKAEAGRPAEWLLCAACAALIGSGLTPPAPLDERDQT